MEAELRGSAEDFVGRFGGISLALGAQVGETRATVGVRRGRGTAAPGVYAVFEIGSITKVFTALALADMAREGVLELETPARELAPSAPWPEPVGREITLADLACHGSGFAGTPLRLLLHVLPQWNDPYVDFDVARLYDALDHMRPKRAPGERFEYSNLNYGLLGHLLARAAGCSWEQLVAARVCEPLGLRDTHPTVPPLKLGRLERGHNRRGRPVPAWTMPDGIAGAGALHSTVDDLLTFLGAHLRPGSTALGPAIELARRPRLRIGRRAAVGLGWLMVAPRRGPRIIWHSGGTGGFRSYVGLAPDGGRTAVAALSGSKRSPDRLGDRLVKRLDR
jgi:serine-type D-Ala-D-Ala carboxypeptidase/endopeptidase